MTPKEMLVAVYQGTQTHANIFQNPTAPVLLQLLTEPLAPVVRVCGQQSGKKSIKWHVSINGMESLLTKIFRTSLTELE